MTHNEALSDAKVLIVDDAPANLDLLRKLLEPMGCQIFFATNGEMAIKVAPDSLPDIILMDVMMPGIDGFETCRRLKQNDSLREVPVIFITAKTDVADLARGFEVGGVDYITKPVKRQEVHARVGAHIKIKRLIEEQARHLEELALARKELQELSASKDKFLSNIGRGLKDSLAEISRASTSLKSIVAERKLKGLGLNQRLDAVNDSSQNLMRVLENILEWPRVQLGQKLDLFNTKVTDDDLGYLLSSLDELRFLSLAQTNISDKGLVHLKRLKRLQELHLDNTGITNKGLDMLAGISSLQVLDLKHTRISDEGLAALKPLRGLRCLYLTHTDITDAGLVYLKSFKDLETLMLWDTAVSDEGLLHLEGLSRLRELILWGTRVTDDGVKRLSSALPECDISTEMLM